MLLKNYNLPQMQMLVVLALAMLLAACGGGRVELSQQAQGRQVAAGGIYKIGTPYQIAGEWYYPRENTSYDNVGIASWYGPQFDGKRTANGEIFDMRLLTAAHPTLPMPIMAKVTNVENGKSLIVRINDRGPFKKNREIDLSKRGAEILGFVERGTAKVRVQYLERAPLYGASGRLIQGVEPTSFITKKPSTPRSAKRITAAPIDSVESFALDGSTNAASKITPPPTQNLYAVQVGAFSDIANAEKLAASLRGNFPNRAVAIEKSGAFYRVKTGGANIREDALAIRSQLLEAGHQDAIVIDQHIVKQ